MLDRIGTLSAHDIRAGDVLVKMEYDIHRIRPDLATVIGTVLMVRRTEGGYNWLVRTPEGAVVEHEQPAHQTYILVPLARL